MKLITSTLLLALSFQSIGQEKTTNHFDLDDPKQVKEQMTIFVKAIQSGDTATEFSYRTDYALNWRYKSMVAAPDFIDRDISLSEYGYLSSIKFGDLHIDKESRMIMRTHYTEPGNKKNKHRYAFHVDLDGKIDQVLYVPPITKEYFPEWEDEDFRMLISKLDTATIYIDEIEPEMYEFESFSCGGVMPDLEEMIVEELELSDEDIEDRKQLAENTEDDAIIEEEDKGTEPLNEAPNKFHSKLNK